jgi:hypothetical protein
MLVFSVPVLTATADYADYADDDRRLR